MATNCSHGQVRIRSRAPTRIDLAGGTVDLWPLFLFLKNPTTVNLAIDLFAETDIDQDPAESRADTSVFLKSEDQGIELKLPWSALQGYEQVGRAPGRDSSDDVHPALSLHFKMLRHFAAKRMASGKKDHLDSNLRLVTRAKSPAGAGLGGSSGLNISMTGALASWALGKAIDPAKDGERLIEISRDIETTVIQVPAGVQDYYGAMFGGLQSLRWRPGSHEREHLPESILAELEKRLLLFYSGQSRNSGINNWALFKGMIDNQDGVRAKFQRIADATNHLETALRAGNWEEAGRAIAEEWATRKTLAAGITTDKMDRAFERAAQVAPVSGKVCGAGGGGCFFIYIPRVDPKDPFAEKKRIQEAFSDQGLLPLPFRASPGGLEVRFLRG
jgi:D-glycero-alpha-D-manno-heptose-7-phosphate kinase